jgi:periplasmic mercuric ion binding protein
MIVGEPLARPDAARYSVGVWPEICCDNTRAGRTSTHKGWTMKMLQLLAIGTLALASGGAAKADTTVELKGTHLCCGQCVRAVDDILKKEGVTGKCDQKAGTVTITAKDDAAAQKALDALAAGGFHGTTDSKDLKVKDDSGVDKGKVKTLTLEGVHNCCGACNKAINAAVGKVAGVTGNTAKVKSDTFEVTGEFDAEELVKALNAAGYHVKVKK